MMHQTTAPSTEPASEEPLTVEEFHSFLARAEAAGFTSRSFCYTHDAPPLNEEEDADFGEGFDPCIPVVRIW